MGAKIEAKKQLILVKFTRNCLGPNSLNYVIQCNETLLIEMLMFIAQDKIQARKPRQLDKRWFCGR